MIQTLEAHSWRVKVDPLHGATVLSARWRHPDGAWLPVLEPLADPVAGLSAGCFVMAPFANRIADGGFSFDGREFQIPINRPGEGMAIHGFSRERPWDVTDSGAEYLVLSQRIAAPDLPWRYDISQTITLAPAGVTIALRVTNAGLAAMPFGIGLHPWFPKPPGSTLSFTSAGGHRRDARGLPLPQTYDWAGFSPADPAPLDQMPWFDGCFSAWSPCRARITWPDRDAELEISAGGAFRHLHVYVPDDRAVFCAEPVSHLPDALNRPDLGEGAAMTVLPPGESLVASMTLSARALTAQGDASDQKKVPQ